jgi:protocatechuate 3,4-dioxygenase beta subunit
MPRLLLCILLCPGLVAQSRPAADPATLARVEGRVTNSATGEPLRKTQLVLHGGTTGEYVATSDANGRFVIERIAPGTYTLTGQHQNFALLDYGSTRPGVPGRRFTLTAGQSMTGLELKMIPFGVIAGKVIDPDGDPVAGVPITVLRWGFVRGGRQLLPAGGGGSTNDKGEYRIYNLAAGRYYVAARPVRADYISTFGGLAPRNVPPQSETGREALSLTFYPSTLDASGATPVALVAGQEIGGIDLQLRKTRTYTVQGKVNGVQQGGRYSVAMQPQDSVLSGSFGLNRTAAVRPNDGSFIFRGVSPGRYTLTAMVENRVGSRQDLSIGDGDLDGLVIPILDAGSVKGRIQLDSGLTRPTLRGIRISLTPADGSHINPPNAASGEDGTFAMAEVAPDRYRVVATPPEGSYLKTIRWGGQVVNEGVVEMPSGGNVLLDLVFAGTKAQIEGEVKGADDQPAPSVPVLLIPASRRESDFRLTMSDQNGHFLAKGLAPGAYAALATDASIFSLPDAAFVKALEKLTTAVTVEENGQATVQLKVVPESAVEAVQ